MRCPGCGHEDADGRTECTRCGLVFAKFHARADQPAARPQRSTTATAAAAASHASPATSDDAEPTLLEELRESAFDIDAGTDLAVVLGRAAVFALPLWWTLGFWRHPMQAGYISASFLHLVNLPFHEAGHFIFAPLGDFMTSLGGSLNQVLIPLLCAGTFLYKTRDAFGAAVALWWAGESLLDVAPYIADARALQLVLIGGHTGAEVEGHDWEAILGSLGLLQWDIVLGRA